MYERGDPVEAGGLMSYEADDAESFRRAPHITSTKSGKALNTPCWAFWEGVLPSDLSLRLNSKISRAE